MESFQWTRFSSSPSCHARMSSGTLWSDSARRVVVLSPSPGLTGSGFAGMERGRTTTLSGALRRLRRKANRPKQSENVIMETPTGNTPTCGHGKAVSLSVVPSSRVESRKTLCLPPGSSTFRESGAMGAGRAKRTRNKNRQFSPRSAWPPSICCSTRQVSTAGSTLQSDSAQQSSAAAPSRNAPELPTDSAVTSISAPKSSV